ncbi:manganese-binding transcriptional regulator MntR [Roseomonas sp. OT10]|uniref:manganese-binding transcriptional regulator MntR n=1 Tax=Roseomonas cutis TaxID=2897332 RepID=UPI001E30BB14|nr:manganese-binding transcriptional regulator MntR [Roseomonas sp. OT10]UFN49906.1 manganese-binding transcriptional regulator MntR [Roseomonas sp. OT10]
MPSRPIRDPARIRSAVPADPAPHLLPAEDDQAARHASARAGRASAVLEDYVELIDDLLAEGGEARPTDLARRFGVSHATAIKSIARLKALGLAHSRPYRGVFLTPEGHALAERVRARHRVVVDLLLAVGVPAEVAETDAEGIEHHVSDATLAAFARFLAGPGRGPGDTGPAGK